MLWVFLFKSKAAYEMRISDWSSHVRSSDLPRRRRCPSSPDRRPTSAKRTDPMFKRPSNHYGRSPGPVTPYQRAAQVWDDRIGSARVQEKNWRFAFFGALLISG